jgi:hypothetical protein
MLQPFAGIIANQLTRSLATSALPGAPVRQEELGPAEGEQPRRVRRVAARALASTANRLDPAAARASLAR